MDQNFLTNLIIFIMDNIYRIDDRLESQMKVDDYQKLVDK